MQEDSVRYFQDLIENYRQMSDGQLLELAEKPEDLTEVAQQVLRDEIGRRRLDKRPSPAVGRIPGPVPRKHFDFVSGYPPPIEDDSAEPSESDLEDGPPLDYTWKTVLCEFSEAVQARQLHAALKRAGIENWVESLPPHVIGRVLVAADQLELARAVVAQPIPPDIIEESQIELPEFATPVCPKCGALDPVLDSVDPVNAWYCETCGAEWTDTEPGNDDDVDREKTSPP